MRQIAQAISRLRFAEQARATQLQVEAERLRNSLLSAISHDLRTPLATIVGSASAMAEDHGQLQPQQRLELATAIAEEAGRMARLINNILDMARLDAGMVELHREWHRVEEIIGTVMNQLQVQCVGRPITIQVPPGMPMLYADSVLIEQVLANLLENALRYTPAGSALAINVETGNAGTAISVADQGPGIPKGLEDKLFEKFYQTRRESAQSGVGLGLAICRAIVEVHGGHIYAQNRPEGGAMFTFTIPAHSVPPLLALEEP